MFLPTSSLFFPCCLSHHLPLYQPTVLACRPTLGFVVDEKVIQQIEKPTSFATTSLGMRMEIQQPTTLTVWLVKLNEDWYSCFWALLLPVADPDKEIAAILSLVLQMGLQARV